MIPQVEQALPAAGGNGLEIRLPIGELRAVFVEQAQLRCVARVVGGDDQVEF